MQNAQKEGGGVGGEAAILAALKTFSMEGYAFKSAAEDSKSGVLTLHFDRAGAPPQPPNPVHRAAPGSATAMHDAASAKSAAVEEKGKHEGEERKSRKREVQQAAGAKEGEGGAGSKGRTKKTRNT